VSTGQLPLRPDGPAAAGSGAPDPAVSPEYYSWVATRRAIAYLIDLVVLAFLMAIELFAFKVIGVLTFGLLAPILVLAYTLTPLAYHTLLIGGRGSATLGMRAMDVEVRTWTGGRPGYVQAALQTIVFYVTVGLTSFLILVVALFNSRRRCLHDYLCGTVVIRTLPRARMAIDAADA